MPDPLNLEYKLGESGESLLIKDSVLVSFPSSRADFTFEQGDELDLGKVKLKGLHTPGHCRGHSSFYWEKEGLLFSADIDFSILGPWYFNESADIDEFIDSIHRITEIDPRITVPGHGRIKAPIGKAARSFFGAFQPPGRNSTAPVGETMHFRGLCQPQPYLSGVHQANHGVPGKGDVFLST